MRRPAKDAVGGDARPSDQRASRDANIRRKQRDCVLYAFYCLQDDVRIEVAITDTMLREGRVDVRRALVSDPITGNLVPVADSLAKGFVFGMVFTQAERVPQHTESSTITTTNNNNNATRGDPIFWLEVFHHRHDIYQIERVFDPHLSKLVPVADVMSSGIIDPIRCTYTHPISGALYSIENALYHGWIQALPVANPPPFDLIGGTFDNIHVRTLEEGFRFTSINRKLTVNALQPTRIVEPVPPIEKEKPELEPSTVDLKRWMHKEPTPEYRPAQRKTPTAISYQVKPGYELTADGRVKDVTTGKVYSLAEALALGYVVQTEGQTETITPVRHMHKCGSDDVLCFPVT